MPLLRTATIPFGAGDGVTGVVLLAESHISIHTWPESGLAAADIFMCGGADPRRALKVLIDGLVAAHQHVHILARGFAERMALPAQCQA
jgi:S-adenosylmethionine decarboxylase